jgi:ATP-dependent DNA helicase HFM1/MER3
LIDEVHILNEERGATVEAVVSRLKLLFNIGVTGRNEGNIDKNSLGLRFIAVSATLPNINDIAEWLLVKECNSHMFGRYELV